MAAYAALLSLAQTTDLIANQDNQYRFSFKAESKIRSIHDYVNFLLSFLENSPKEAISWEDKVREVAHKIEDLIQHYMWQQMKSMRQSSELFEGQLKKSKKDIALIVEQMMEERPAHIPAAAVSVPSSSTARKDAVIGLEADVTAIKDRLCGHSFKLQVIPIVGMGGIGKTTLARTVYDDPLILYYFDIHAWVTVSQDYSPHKLRKILLGLVDSVKLFEKELSGEMINESGEVEELYEKELSGEKIHEFGELEVEGQVSGEMIEESQLRLKVYQSLKGKRYLIVMDDVWSTDVWDDLRDLFPDDSNGSRIMLTTRLSDLATYPNFGSPLHEMRFMDDYQSWDLLKQNVFTDSSNIPPELEDVGKEIAQKCAGLPLAVVLVAGRNCQKCSQTRASWEEIARSENLVVKEELEEILSFSYTHLPHHLRPCFLYIRGFPEDEEIHASRLIKLWVAEGFLKNQFRCSKSLEDEAEVYLDDLVKRNLVLVTSRKTNGKIKSCSLHDTVRDMCVRKAREEKFLRVLDGSDLSQGLMNERRISFNHSDINGIFGPTIRSILCFQLQSFDGWETFLQSSTLLKVLNGVGSPYQPLLPSQVFDLFHLTHLVLIGSFDIPSAISNLVNLQTLIIHPTFRQRKRKWRDNYKNASHFSLPLEIWRMRKLRHLILCDLYRLPPPPDESNLPLEKLQTLSPLENLVWSGRMVQMIPNVKKLELVYSSNEEYHLHHLDCLHQLEKLQITGYNDFSWRRKNLAFSTTLQKLSLVGVKFPWKDMSIIGSLPNLQVLKLLNHACHGETWETDDGEFLQLTFLLIDRSLLQQWTHGSSSFPKLRCLVLRSCVCLQEIPESIGEIPTLELIEVYDCGRSLVESVEKIREDQRSYGNDTLQVRVICSDEVRPLPSYSAAAYAQTTDLSAHLPSAAVSSPAMVGEAFEKNLERIWRLLEAGEVLRIGIHGMGGSGKSELAKQINNRLVEQSQGSVFRVVVSQDFSIKSLQDKIAHSVGAKDILDGNDEVDERAAKLYKFLSQEKKNSVLILDDVWENIDLLKVGCPISTGCCRLIITTRSLEVCHQIGCQEIIAVQKLNKDDAWKLFSETLSLKLSPQVEKIAKYVANFCDGFPLAIKIVAGSMRGMENIHTWRNTLLEVKECLVGETEVFRVLKYSFDWLNKKHDKSQSDEEFNLPQLCFLYCSLYPEDSEIRRETLVRDFISEGLLNQRKSRREQFDQGYCILDTLVEVCLLENCVDYCGRKCVKMHDLVRGMALKIREGKYMVRAGKSSKEIPKEEEWTEDLEKVSLMKNHIWSIPDGTSPPICPKLSTLLLQWSGLQFIPDSFFTEMQGLCTLDLSGSWIKKLPNSISELKILKALRLGFCFDLEYVPYLGKLKGLRELNLDGTAIEEVPQGVEELLNLEFLSIDARRLKMLPEGLLLKLVRLQFVRLPNHLHVAIEEVKNLKELEEFSGTVKNVSDYNSFVTSRVHDTFYRILVQSSIKGITLEGFEVADKLYYDCKNKEVILKKCNLKDEKVLLEQDIECLAITLCEGESNCFLDDFEGVRILKAGEVGPQALFSSLKRLDIYGCHKMRKLGLPVLAFPNLEFICISSCRDMEEIFEDEGKGSDVRLRELRLYKLPSLKRVCKATIICNSIEEISILQCPRLMKKLPLHLDDPLPPNLKCIWVEREWWESLEWDNLTLPTLLQSFVEFF